MKARRIFQNKTAAFLAAGMMLVSPLLANDTAVRTWRAPQVTDVALRDGGVLLGQVVNTERRPVASEQVVVRLKGEQVATVKTDANGRFAVRGLRGGMHTIETASHRGVYHLWGSNIAPPSAHAGVVVVNSGQTIVRGQDGSNLGPLVGGALIGGVIGGVLYFATEDNSPAS